MKRFAMVLSVAVLAGVIAPKQAEACGRFEEFRRPQVNETLRDVRRSEHLLAQGKFDKAAKLARRAFKNIDELPSNDAALFDRAQRVAALASLRSGGTVDPTSKKPAQDEYARAVNVQWAHHVLMFQSAKASDNLVVRTEYAEAVAAVPGLDDLAFDLLRGMADDDLMPTARGFALLASLQGSRGDDVGRDTSLRRCRELGDDKELTVCNIA